MCAQTTLKLYVLQRHSIRLVEVSVFEETESLVLIESWYCAGSQRLIIHTKHKRDDSSYSQSH